MCSPMSAKQEEEEVLHRYIYTWRKGPNGRRIVGALWLLGIPE